jgi:hypothetical protein
MRPEREKAIEALTGKLLAFGDDLSRVYSSRSAYGAALAAVAVDAYEALSREPQETDVSLIATWLRDRDQDRRFSPHLGGEEEEDARELLKLLGGAGGLSETTPLLEEDRDLLVYGLVARACEQDSSVDERALFEMLKDADQVLLRKRPAR